MHKKSRLGTIDAKLNSYTITEAERALLLARRRHLTNAKKRNGHEGNRLFILQAARMVGLSPRTIYRDLRRADELGIPLLERIVGTALDHGRRLDLLVKLTKQQREHMVRRAKNGEPYRDDP